MKQRCIGMCFLFAIILSFTSVRSDDVMFSPEMFDGHDAVILEAKGYFNDKYTRDLSRETYTYKIGFVTRKGIEDHGDHTIVFNPSREHVSDVGGTVYLPDGTTARIGRDHIFRKPVVRRGRRRLTEVKIVFPALEIGAVAEVTLSRSFTGIRDTSYWPFQSALYTLHSELTFIPWYGKHWGYSMINVIERPAVQETRPGGSAAYTFTRKNIPALEKENYSLAYSCLREALHIFYDDTRVDHQTFWSQEMQRFYRRRLRPFMNVCRPAKNLVSEHIDKEKHGSDEERLFAVYDYVINNFASLAMLSRQEEETISDSHRKNLREVRNISQLFRYNYVTDWQMTYILASMIKAALPGAKVELVMYLPWDEGCFDQHLQSIGQFTERMLKVSLGNTSYWLNPAKRFMPPNMTEWNANGTQMLVLGEGGAALERLPLDNASDNVSRIVMQITFDPEEGYADIVQKTEFDRYESYDLRSELMFYTEHERKEVLETMAKKVYGNDVEISEFSLENLDSLSEPLILNLTCRFPYEFEDSGDFFLMNMPGLIFPRTNPFDRDQRNSRIVFSYPHTEQREVTWILPEGYIIDSHPRNVSINRNTLTYRIDYNRIDDRQLKAVWEKILQGNMLRSDAAGLLKRTWNSIMEAGNQRVIIRRDSAE